MNFIEKALEMLGFNSKAKSKSNSVGPDISKAIQRNEFAQASVRRELDKIKMSDTLKAITGKMK